MTMFSNALNLNSVRRRGVATRRPCGFTLLEVMVVLVVIAVLMAIATLSIRDGGKKQIQDEASRFVLLVEALVDEAIIDSTMFGVLISDENYQFVRYHIEQQRWQPWQRKPFSARTLPEDWRTTLWLNDEAIEIPNIDDVRISASTDKDDDNGDDQNNDDVVSIPQIIILPDGEITPFLLEWQSPNYSSQIELADGFSTDFTIQYEQN
ncbi:MAG: type II secretion system minor pseudopilin GspH [Gammaproteobacteria bacterium]|nr:type II secretion system minor pseudopilin GspH [Gammaproteobacteria bacterium]